MTEAAQKPSLDARLYKLSDEDKAFFKQQTAINDDEELKKHIIAVQTEAFEVGEHIDCSLEQV
jgi:hypothetical protein